MESKSHYVAEWAARHGTILPEARHTTAMAESRLGTEETLSLEEGRRSEGQAQIIVIIFFI